MMCSLSKSLSWNSETEVNTCFDYFVLQSSLIYNTPFWVHQFQLHSTFFNHFLSEKYYTYKLLSWTKPISKFFIEKILNIEFEIFFMLSEGWSIKKLTSKASLWTYINLEIKSHTYSCVNPIKSIFTCGTEIILPVLIRIGNAYCSYLLVLVSRKSKKKKTQTQFSLLR